MIIYFYFKHYKLLGYSCRSLVEYEPNIHMGFIFIRTKERKTENNAGDKGRDRRKKGKGDDIVIPNHSLSHHIFIFLI